MHKEAQNLLPRKNRRRRVESPRFLEDSLTGRIEIVRVVECAWTGEFVRLLDESLE